MVPASGVWRNIGGGGEKGGFLYIWSNRTNRGELRSGDVIVEASGVDNNAGSTHDYVRCQYMACAVGVAKRQKGWALAPPHAPDTEINWRYDYAKIHEQNGGLLGGYSGPTSFLMAGTDSGRAVMKLMLLKAQTQCNQLAGISFSVKILTAESPPPLQKHPVK